MSLRQLLGLDKAGISDIEIIEKLQNAQKQALREIDFNLGDGSVVKIRLPSMF